MIKEGEACQPRHLLIGSIPASEVTLIATVLAVLAAFGFILTALEIFLTETQKGAVTTCMVRVWNALDDWKRLSFVEPLKRRSVRFLYFAIGALLVAILFVGEYLDNNVDDYVGFSALVAASLGILYVVVLLPWTLRAQNTKTLLSRVATFLLVPFLVVLYFAIFETWKSELFFNLPFELYSLIHFSQTTFAILLIVILPFWLAMAVPLIVAYCGTLMLYMAELLVRSLAQYPKGPILAVSAIFGALATLLKAFGK